MNGHMGDGRRTQGEGSRDGDGDEDEDEEEEGDTTKPNVLDGEGTKTMLRDVDKAGSGHYLRYLEGYERREGPG